MRDRPVYKIVYNMKKGTCAFAYTNGKLSKPIKVTFSTQQRLSKLSYNSKIDVRIGWDAIFIDRKTF